MDSDFKSRLIEGMNMRGLKPVDLAEKTGMSKSRISHYTSGRYEAKQEALYLIAKALDVNEAWLMGHNVPMDRDIAEREVELGKESILYRQIQLVWGHEAVELLTNFVQLNGEGKNKVIDYTIDLGKVECYIQEKGVIQ